MVAGAEQHHNASLIIVPFYRLAYLLTVLHISNMPVTYFKRTEKDTSGILWNHWEQHK